MVADDSPRLLRTHRSCIRRQSRGQVSGCAVEWNCRALWRLYEETRQLQREWLKRLRSQNRFAPPLDVMKMTLAELLKYRREMLGCSEDPL
jgi:hypothetical protein